MEVDKIESYYISLPYATFGVTAKNRLIIDAAPIAGWSLKKDLGYVLNFYKKKQATIKKLICAE